MEQVFKLKSFKRIVMCSDKTDSSFAAIMYRYVSQLTRTLAQQPLKFSQ